jgi:hypothetical protein
MRNKQMQRPNAAHMAFRLTELFWTGAGRSTKHREIPPARLILAKNE